MKAYSTLHPNYLLCVKRHIDTLPFILDVQTKSEVQFSLHSLHSSEELKANDMPRCNYNEVIMLV